MTKRIKDKTLSGRSIDKGAQLAKMGNGKFKMLIKLKDDEYQILESLVKILNLNKQNLITLVINYQLNTQNITEKYETLKESIKKENKDLYVFETLKESIKNANKEQKELYNNFTKYQEEFNKKTTNKKIKLVEIEKEKISKEITKVKSDIDQVKKEVKAKKYPVNSGKGQELSQKLSKLKKIDFNLKMLNQKRNYDVINQKFIIKGKQGSEKEINYDLNSEIAQTIKNHLRVKEIKDRDLERIVKIGLNSFYYKIIIVD